MNQNTTKFPRFIPDIPVGEDCFEGHSQEILAHSVCDYIRLQDEGAVANATSNTQEKTFMPRILGIEGSWGSGKSNVVNMIERELSKEGYFTFTYDAWGHQEDLQRRSILETLAINLISNEVLQGDVEIQMRNGKKHKAAWKDQLTLLLSNKTTTIRKSTPRLTVAAYWGIFIVSLFAVCSLVADQLISNFGDFKCLWWIDIIPIGLALAVVGVYWIKDHSFENIFRMIDHTNSDTIDEEYTSSEEPSVSEFKNWMYAVSLYLGKSSNKYKKLIIVFDNMDRLPSEKVMQLWSSIYTFFAGGEFENIWAVIPYDYMHLCQAIYGSKDEKSNKENVERVKQFISKTFPITFHVPQPVITDYRKLFSTYFDKAFGPSVHDKEHICQVFMHLQKYPNPRTVIRFVNELVAMRLRWDEDKYRLQNLALYILKKDFIFYSDKRLDEQLLSEELFKGVEPFYPNQEKVRIEMCQYAYGLEDENLASETPLRNELKRKTEEGLDISELANNSNFISVLESVIADIDLASIDNAILSMASLDGVELSNHDKGRIQAKWDYLANFKAKGNYEKQTYDDTLSILIAHATDVRKKQLAKSYIAAMQKITISNGADYFNVMNKLQMALNEANIAEEPNWYQTIECAPEQFVQYASAAGNDYRHYKLRVDNDALNTFLLDEAVRGSNRVTDIIDFIKDDETYSFDSLKKELSDAIEADSIENAINVAAYVHRVLDEGEGILDVRFKKDKVSSFITASKINWSKEQPKGMEDIVAMFLADGEDVDSINDEMIKRVCECMERYLDYTELLKHTGNEGSAYRKLNVYCIEHQEGNLLDENYAANKLENLHDTLGVDINVMLKHFNRWPKIDWGEMNKDNQYIANVKSYVHQSLFEAYLDNPGNFTNSIIGLGVSALELQEKGFLAIRRVQRNYYSTEILAINEYWKDFVETYLGTPDLPEADTKLTGEAITILDWLYEKDEMTDSTLLDAILRKADKPTLVSYLHKMMNDHFVKSDISKQKFMHFGNLLPLLGSNMDSNTARGLMQHFIKPICKDAECAKILIANKSFYFSVMLCDQTYAQSILNEVRDLEVYLEVKEELEDMLL